MIYLEDPKCKLDILYHALDKKPFVETGMIYIIKSEIEEKQTGIIQEAIEIGEKFVVANKISLHISPQVILASIKVAEKTKSSLLFAHTHPSSELFPKEFQVFKDTEFTKSDLYFNERVNKLLKEREMISKSVYYLTINKETYCAIMWNGKKYFNVTIPAFEKKNIRKSSWEIEGYVSNGR